MADIFITDSAEAAIRELVNELGNYDQPATPCLMVQWSAGASENWRGPSGEAIWEQVDPAGWAASVGGWADTPERDIKSHTMQVRGFNVLRDARAEIAVGTFVIDAADRKLTVALHPKARAGTE